MAHSPVIVKAEVYSFGKPEDRTQSISQFDHTSALLVDTKGGRYMTHSYPMYKETCKQTGEQLYIYPDTVADMKQQFHDFFSNTDPLGFPDYPVSGAIGPWRGVPVVIATGHVPLTQIINGQKRFGKTYRQAELSKSGVAKYPTNCRGYIDDYLLPLFFESDGNVRDYATNEIIHTHGDADWPLTASAFRPYTDRYLSELKSGHMSQIGKKAEKMRQRKQVHYNESTHVPKRKPKPLHGSGPLHRMTMKRVKHRYIFK